MVIKVSPILFFLYLFLPTPTHSVKWGYTKFCHSVHSYNIHIILGSWVYLSRVIHFRLSICLSPRDVLCLSGGEVKTYWGTLTSWRYIHLAMHTWDAVNIQNDRALEVFDFLSPGYSLEYHLLSGATEVSSLPCHGTDLTIGIFSFAKEWLKKVILVLK